jgi:hypothetical protein
VAPFTPIKVLQKVGEALEILAGKLTEEKLMAFSAPEQAHKV